MRGVFWLILALISLVQTSQLKVPSSSASGFASPKSMSASNVSTSTHLKLTGALNHSAVDKENAALTPPADDSSLFVTITEFFSTETNRTLLGIVGKEEQCRTNLQHFSVHVLKSNLSLQEGVTIRETNYNLSDQASLEKINLLFKSERLISMSKDFPPPVLSVGKMKMKKSFEDTLMGHAMRIKNLYIEKKFIESNANRSLFDDDLAIRQFLQQQKRQGENGSESW